MIVDILQHTPLWVFAVFLLLVVLGVRQLRAGRVSLVRVAVLPIAMGALSLQGIVSTFSLQSTATVAWIAMAALGVVAGLALPPRTGVQYSTATRSFTVPGSAVPLVLMMTIFFTKYATAVVFATHPALRATTEAAIGAGMLSGLVSALFIARALRTIRVASGAAGSSRLLDAAS